MGSKKGVTAWRLRNQVTVAVPEEEDTKVVLVRNVKRPEEPPRLVTVRKVKKKPKPKPRPVVKEAPQPDPRAKTYAKGKRRIVSPKPKPKPALPPESKEEMAESLPILRYGAGMKKGEEHLAPFVIRAQTAVEASPIDGKYGWGTYASVKRYQITHTHNGNKLQVDGVVGPNTWGAIMGNA